jgi:hypothetical protein
MKARNNYNDGFSTEYFDSNQIDGDDFTPVNNKKKSVSSIVAPKKEQQSIDISLDQSTVSQKLNFEIFTPTKPPVDDGWTNAPKKSRRNLDALGENITQPVFENKQFKNESVVLGNKRNNRELSGLEEEILQSQQQKNTKSGRNLDLFGEQIMQEQNIRNEKFAKHENYKKHSYQRYEYPPEPVVEKKEINVNMNDSDLFPTLGKSAVDVKKLSVWNVFNPTVLVKNETPVVKQTPNFKLVEKSMEPNTTVLNNSTQNYYDNGDDEDDDQEYYNEDEEEYEYEEDEDSDIVYMREKYYKRDEILDNIQFVKNNFNKQNIDHVRFLHQLECELANIEDEIYRFEDLENEMENIYGPYYRNPPSLLDEAKRRHEEAENEAKLKDPGTWKEFFRMLETVKA